MLMINAKRQIVASTSLSSLLVLRLVIVLVGLSLVIFTFNHSLILGLASHHCTFSAIKMVPLG